LTLTPPIGADEPLASVRIGQQSSSELASGNHVQATLPGYVFSSSGLWVPDTRDSYGMDVDAQRVRAPINQREWGTFFSLRGQRFSATTGYVTVNLNGTSPIAALRNPSDSGVWMFFDELEFGAVGATGRFSRLGGGTLSNVSNPQTWTPTGGGSEVAKSQLYVAPNYTVTGASVRRVAAMGDARPYWLYSKGRGIVRPGGVVNWATTEAPGGGTGTYEVYINFEVVEIPTADATALAAAMASTPLF
jgi:hypothetical protein